MSIWIPVTCPRGLKDCTALATIESDCGKSFICCGHNTKESRELDRDRFRHCFVNSETDTMYDYDEHDLIDTISVLSQAFSVDLHMKKEDAAIKGEGE